MHGEDCAGQTFGITRQRTSRGAERCERYAAAESNVRSVRSDICLRCVFVEVCVEHERDLPTHGVEFVCVLLVVQL